MKINKKSKVGTHIIVFISSIFISGLFLNTCDENPAKFTLGEEFVESKTDLSLIDTFSVNLSTVILDTVLTSGTGSLLIGNYRDDIIGKITSHSYFQIGKPDSYEVQYDEIYDSLKLILRYNRYSFGDTTQSQKILVHQLSEKIETDNDEIITSATSFDFYPDPIGSIIYQPEPTNDMDTVAIKISDNIGLDLFTKLRENSEILTSTESFIDYFHGLVLMADEMYEGSIVGFNTANATLTLYTNRGTAGTEKINYEFALENSSKQFNNIVHDFSQTQLNPLVKQRHELSSTKCGGLSFLQGGIGLLIRVDFPSLQEILLIDRGTIVEAQLCISALKNSSKEVDLPSELYIYKSNKLNRINEIVYNNQGGVVTPNLNLDELYNEDTTYLFDITKYLNDELADSYIDPENGLLITLPYSDSGTSFDRLIMDSHHKNTKLKIYFFKY